MSEILQKSVKQNPVKIAILASGRGSNFEAIQNAISEGRLNAEVVALISDRVGAPVLSRARSFGIPAFEIPGVSTVGTDLSRRRQAHERLILERLAPFQPQFLVLAGYMRILTSTLIEGFRSERGYSRMVNIHPSLLPAFPGLRSYAQAFEYGVKWTGVSVHLVELEVDRGPICAQEAFSIEGCSSVEQVEKIGLEREHRLYPQTLEWLLKENFILEHRSGGRFYVRPN